MNTSWRHQASGRAVQSALGLASVVAFAAVLVAGSPVAANASAGNYFSLTLGACTLNGSTASKSATVHVSWKSSSSVSKLTQTVTSHHHAWHTGCISGGVTTGDKLSMTVGSKTIKLKVPAFTITSHRINDKVDGVAPKGGTSHLYVRHHKTPKSSVTYTAKLNPDNSGHYSKDFTSAGGIWGGDDVNGYWQDSKGDNLSVSGIVPQVILQRGSDQIRGWMQPGSGATVTLEDSSHAFKDSVSFASNYGPFFAVFAGSTSVAAGDFVDATDIAADALLHVPNVKVSGVASTDVIKGKCQAHGWYTVKVSRGSKHYSFSAKAGASGKFHNDVTGHFNVKSGDNLIIWCWQNTGDQIIGTNSVP